MLKIDRELESSNHIVGVFIDTPGVAHILDVRTQIDPWGRMHVVIDLGDPFRVLDSNGTLPEIVLERLDIGHATVDVGAPERKSNLVRRAGGEGAVEIFLIIEELGPAHRCDAMSPRHAENRIAESSRQSRPMQSVQRRGNGCPLRLARSSAFLREDRYELRRRQLARERCALTGPLRAESRLMRGLCRAVECFAGVVGDRV